jgi:hypothetical protein
MPCCAVPVFKLSESALLPISPLEISCLLCGAKAGHDCATTSDGFSAIHVARIKAATRINNSRKRKVRLKKI